MCSSLWLYTWASCADLNPSQYFSPDALTGSLNYNKIKYGRWEWTLRFLYPATRQLPSKNSVLWIIAFKTSWFRWLFRKFAQTHVSACHHSWIHFHWLVMHAVLHHFRRFRLRQRLSASGWWTVPMKCCVQAHRFIHMIVVGRTPTTATPFLCFKIPETCRSHRVRLSLRHLIQAWSIVPLLNQVSIGL